MVIDVHRLHHTYSAGTPLERPALRGVSLRIGSGERVGIAGPTGSGKSTLLQHLSGLLEPTAGHVHLDGVPAHKRTPMARRHRRRIGIAFQYPEDQFFEQTVSREVGYGPRNLGLDEEEIAARVSWALTMVSLDLETVGSRNPFTLSGGEARRISLASILALQPDVLLLDEPTAGLDPRGRRSLLGHIAESHARLGMTLILVSHDLDALARVVDRIVLLDQGVIAADGSVQRVLGSVETLRSAGLEPPGPVALLHSLRLAGLAVRTDRVLAEEAAAEVARALSGHPQTDKGTKAGL